MATLNDVLMADAVPKAQSSGDYSDLVQTPHSDAFAFTDLELRALELYDELRELELQHSLIQAQNTAGEIDVSELSDDVLQEQLIMAEREAMDAKAEYELRNRITHNVLIMDPVLKAVHGGERTDYAEKRILPTITESDVASMLHGSLASRLTSMMLTLSTTEQENAAANERNRELSKALLALAEEARAQSTRDVEDAQLRGKVKAVDKNVKDSKRRLQTLKGILSGMIVGSGINWAEDEILRELVMDDEDDG